MPHKGLLTISCVVALVFLLGLTFLAASSGVIGRVNAKLSAVQPMNVVIDRFVFYPTQEWVGTPQDWGLEYEDVTLTSVDGVRLHGWFIPAENAEITLLFLHGNAGNVSHRLLNLAQMHDLDSNIFIIDYRGYGRSQGSPSEEGIYRDAQAAFQYLLARDDVQPEEVVVFGRSLGGAAAIDLAVKVPVRALIVESTFTSVRDVARIAFPIPGIQRLIPDAYNSEAKIKDVNCPVLVIHGDQDEVIPYHLGQKLFEAAKEPKEFYTIEGAGHNDTYFVGGKPYFQKIKSFLRRRLETETDCVVR